MDSTLSNRLVMLREHCAGKRGQRVFARNVGIKQQSISNYERGSVPSAHVLAKIAMTTGCSAEWLLTGRGSMFPEGVQAPSMGDDEGSPELIDDAGNPVLPDTIAGWLQMSVPDAERWMKQLRQTIPPGDATIVLRTDDEETILLKPRQASPESLADKVEVHASDKDLTIRVPSALLAGRALRIIPID